MMIKREYCGNRPTKIRFLILDIFIDFLVAILRKKRNVNFINPQKILLFNTGHLGDMLMMGYMINLIKQKFPNVEVHVVAGSWNKALLEKNPLFDKVFYINHYKTNRSKASTFAKIKLNIKDVFQFLATQKSISYTHSFDFRYSGFNANILLPFLNIQQKVGFGTRGFGGLLDKEYFMFSESTHTIDVQIQGLALLDIHENSKSIQPVVAMPIEDKNSLDISEAYYMLFPEAGSDHRMFSIEFWIEIIDYILTHKPNVQIVICGLTDYAQKLSEKAEEKYPNAIINAIGKLSIYQIAGTLKNAQGAITLDSFPAHLASTQTPTLCLFKNGTGVEYYPINAFEVHIIHNHKYSKEVTTFRSKMTINYIESFENEIFKKILFDALNKLFSLNP